MSRFRATTNLDRAFEVTLILKGLDGLLEIVGGLILLLVPTATLNQFLTTLTQHELSEDPGDFFVTRLLPLGQHLIESSASFAGLYLLLHGVIKVVLVGAVFADRLWAYPWMIGFLLAFIGYQSYRFVLEPSAGLAALTIFDAVMVWLTAREYRKRREGVVSLG